MEFATGISKEGSILDVAVDHGVVEKSGSWFSYGEERLGQGRENAKAYLRDHPEVARALEAQVRELLAAGIAAGQEMEPEESDELDLADEDDMDEVVADVSDAL
jgi:recombination protein RecA